MKIEQQYIDLLISMKEDSRKVEQQLNELMFYMIEKEITWQDLIDLCREHQDAADFAKELVWYSRRIRILRKVFEYE